MRPLSNRALWIVQWPLALLFLFAGGMKLAVPIEALTQQIPLPGPFLRFIAVAELLGASGLILPGLMRTRQGLTPLAAAGLMMVMIGATVLTLTSAGAGPALFPFAVGILSALVAYGRWGSAALKKSVRHVDSAGFRSI